MAMTTSEISSKPLALTPTGYPNGHNPHSLANLKKGRAKLAEKRKNGELTNPNGYSITSEIKQMLREDAEFISPHARPKDKLFRQQIAREMLVKAAQGDVPMVKEVLDRTEGKVPEPAKDIPVTNINVVFVVGRGYVETPQKLVEVEK